MMPRFATATIWGVRSQGTRTIRNPPYSARGITWMAFLVVSGAFIAIAPDLRGAVSANGTPLPMGWHIVWTGLVGGTVVFGVRLGRSRLSLTSNEVIVRNPLSTNRVPWVDIAGFDVGPRRAESPAYERAWYLRVRGRDGSVFVCHGVPRRGAADPEIQNIVTELNGLLDYHRSVGPVSP